MCQYDTYVLPFHPSTISFSFRSGIQYACGHYIVTSLDRKHDCGNRYCAKSANHPPTCRSYDCIQYYGPDLTQRPTISSAYCNVCQDAFFSHLPRRR
ncbi:hypothetical protein R3P38DRAFT_2839745 [Favolaschia claudopus]|uniref:Uncharacterized protein n=1 Tax=Favolaschia claudopus TaxID=2862362 RepID=A0AAW0DYC1_9AGAR